VTVRKYPEPREPPAGVEPATYRLRVSSIAPGGAGITEAPILVEEIAASGAAMNGCSAIHLSIFGMEPVRRERYWREARLMKIAPVAAAHS
jgi:hypothetical protein